MTKSTKKRFDVLHTKMMAHKSYSSAYNHACTRRQYYAKLNINDLKVLRLIFSKMRDKTAAGIARVCLEEINERERREVVA